MIKLFFSILLCTVCLVFYSCKKSENRTCFKFAGKDTEKEISLTEFDKMKLFQKIEYVLIQDSLNKVVLKGGENLLNLIKVEIADGCLTMENNNKCAFLRSYDRKVKAEIHFTQLSDLEYQGTDNLTNEGTLNLSWFLFKILSGSSTVKLNMNADVVYAYTAGYSDFTFTGKANYSNLVINSNSYCDTYGFEVKDSITVINNSVGLVKINADQINLKAEIKKSGSVWYKGFPVIQTYNQYGTGELLDKN